MQLRRAWGFDFECSSAFKWLKCSHMHWVLACTSLQCVATPTGMWCYLPRCEAAWGEQCPVPTSAPSTWWFFRFRIPFWFWFGNVLCFGFHTLQLRGAGQVEICQRIILRLQIQDPDKDCFDTMLGSDLDDLNIVGRCSKLSCCVITIDPHTDRQTDTHTHMYIYI